MTTDGRSGTALPILAKAAEAWPTKEKAVTMLARSNGFYLIAAATAEQYGHEVPELGHGVLTYALLSGTANRLRSRWR
jgi:uncharacterized caspase-like protein